MTGPAPNLLFYGDNLDVLRQHVDDESIDLVYLDPPFKSNADYNVLFSERDEAQIGVFITLEIPTRPMVREAADAGFYVSDWDTSLDARKKYPRIQILTIEQLLDGQKIDMPPRRHTNVTFKKAPKAKRKSDTTARPLKFKPTSAEDDEDDDE